MSEPQSVKPAGHSSSAVPTDTVVRKTGSPRRTGDSFFALRRPVPQWQGILFGVLCMAIILGIWWLLTAGEGEQRILGYSSLPSPAETFASKQLDQLWFDSALTRNLIASLRRVVLGFALAAAIGIPL